MSSEAVNAAFPLMPIFLMFSSLGEREASNWDFNLLFKTYFNHLNIHGSRPLVPAASANSFSPIASLRKFGSNTLGIGMGLGARVPVRQVFAFGMEAQLGVGLQRQTRTFAAREDVDYTTGQELNAKLYLDWREAGHGGHLDHYMDTFSAAVESVNFDTTALGASFAYSFTL